MVQLARDAAYYKTPDAHVQLRNFVDQVSSKPSSQEEALF
jgi:hypothetical protein